jgi:hypothetical protein
MRAMTTLVMMFVLVAGPAAAAAAQKELAPVDQVRALRSMAGGIPLGSRVKLQIREGRRMTATLMQVTDDAIVVQRVSRVPETPVTVRFDELVALQREDKGGFSIGKAVGIGLAAGGGAILTLFAIMFSLSD